MTQFATFDLNGWFDHIVDETGEARSLGFRSCLYLHEGFWLVGAQALSAARNARNCAKLIDAADALAATAGHGTRMSSERTALPAALWQVVASSARNANGPANLAVIVPDNRFFGATKVREDTGKTALEMLHDALVAERPAALSRSRIELVWRSVAALKSVVDRGDLGNSPGAVLVINVNRSIAWTVLELRAWSRTGGAGGPLHIARSSERDNCKESDSSTAVRASTVRSMMERRGASDLDAIHCWTRQLEILATGMPQESLAKLGIDSNAIEHRSWPFPNGNWKLEPETRLIKLHTASLPQELVRRVQSFSNRDEGPPLAIVLESPVGIEMTLEFEELVRRHAGGIRICRVAKSDAVRAAARLADILGRDPDAPAWLDKVPGLELEVRKRTDPNMEDTHTEWMPVISGDAVIPAGETYHSPPDAARRVRLAPGVEHVHLHLRRGRADAWDERYSGASTGHKIRPSEHVRIVELRARVRPLSGEARIEILEHLQDGRVEALSASRSSVRWSEMEKSRPSALKDIPELYIFEASQEAWDQLRPLLQQVVEAAKEGEIGVNLKDRLYRCTQAQWKDRKFPLGSDGLPPRSNDQEDYQESRKLLHASTNALHSELISSIGEHAQLSVRQANRLHLPLTWLFTGCPEPTVNELLDAIDYPRGDTGRVLHIDTNKFSEWSIYQGVGRAVRIEYALRYIFDNLIEDWERGGGVRQDKYLLAAVSHPMARRVSVRGILAANRERFERVKRFLDRHLDNLLGGNFDSRPDREQPSLELRYVTMGYRGLCQVRYTNRDLFPPEGQDAKNIAAKLQEASNLGRQFERDLVSRTAPYIIGEGVDPTMPGGF